MRDTGKQLVIWSVEEAAARMAETQVYVYDVSPAARYAARHLAGAIRLHPGRFTSEELPIDKHALLLFYCLGGACSASHTAAERAIEMGYDQVHLMPAGIDGWLAAGLPVASALSFIG